MCIRDRDITLQDDSELMDEVVVIGYGTQRKGDVTSAVASVKAEDFTAGKIGDEMCIRDRSRLVAGWACDPDYIRSVYVRLFLCRFLLQNT